MNLGSYRKQRRNYCIALLVAGAEAHSDNALRQELINELKCFVDYIPGGGVMAHYNTTAENKAIADSVLAKRCPGALGDKCKDCLYVGRVIQFKK